MTPEDKEIYVIKINEVYGRVVMPTWELMENLMREFSIWVENAQFDRRYKAGTWNGRIPFVRKDGTFLLGILNKVLDYLKAQTRYKLIVDPKLKNNKNKKEFKEQFIDLTAATLDCPYTYRESQIRGSVKAAYYERGICEHCTGAGKSLTIAMVVNYYLQQEEEHKILVLVPRKDLIEQMTEDFTDYGIPSDLLGKFVGYQKDVEEPVIIATWQSIHKHKDFLKEFTVLIGDECHNLKASVIKSVAENSINARIRLGFTGTMPDPKSEQYLIEGTLGPVIDKVKHEDLVKKDQISKIKIYVPWLIYPTSEKEELNKLMKETVIDRDGRIRKKKGPEKHNDERSFISNHPVRNSLIIKYVRKFIDNDKNALILLNTHEHCDIIVDTLKNSGIEPYIVTGKVNKIEERNEVRKALEESGGNVLVATSGVYSTGISIKRLHCVIFANAGRSKITTLQSVGRGLRMHGTKNKLHLIDIADDLKYGSDQFNDRMKYYSNNNFEVEIKEIELDGLV